ncbi:hypothetical protein KTT_17850 [Tengunoibacter tsumagoiensis]|uniref:histidine kinase n=2 Tax=Tengunoibacter tsumagoiensis TaxID=2014871 RepID=A0A401ZYJ6_9CHLR|nr:hypothetical protein KTT_17850 [Tengunoibacter tsumagoiensis]
MDVGQRHEQRSTPEILTALLNELSAITDYRTLRDSIPRRLTLLLNCQCVLLYQRVDETLQLASASFGEKPGWSAALLAVAHINPVRLSSDIPEARAWRERRPVCQPVNQVKSIMVPLLYRQQCIGVLSALRGSLEGSEEEGREDPVPGIWSADDLPLLEAAAGIVALLLENTRLLEHDRMRIHELSLLNSISSQIHCSLYEVERIRSIVTQRVREIASADLCELLGPTPLEGKGDWLTPILCERLFQRFQDQSSPLILERMGQENDGYENGYLLELPIEIKTFFAIPLLSARSFGRSGSASFPHGSGRLSEEANESKILGIIVGGMYRPWKLRQTELTLLQVLASQAGAALENMHLMDEVVEARNEARKLLRQVLDDQRLKELILESIPSGLITTDLEGRIQTFNHAAEAVLGYSSFEVLGQSLHKFLDLRSTFSSLPYAQPPKTPGQPQELLYTSTYTGEVQQGTVTIEDRYDRELVLEVTINPLCNDLGERIGMLVAFTDMTSMHRLEEEKRRLDRLASLGEMAAGVAHEVRNPLASIKTSIQMLQVDLLAEELPGEDSEPSKAGGPIESGDEGAAWVQQSIAVILKEVERLDTIVRDLLLFAKNGQLHRTRCSFPDICQLVLSMLQPRFHAAGIAVHQVYDELVPAWIDRGQIEQVLLNLCLNALQAMSDGGILTLSCRSIAATYAIRQRSDLQGRAYAINAPGSHVSKEASVQQWLECVISDTGVGMTPDQLQHIFQPFYTTKAHGIGLGLAISRRLVEDHGGYLLIESHLGYGATVVMRLPLLTDAYMQALQRAEGGEKEGERHNESDNSHY